MSTTPSTGRRYRFVLVPLLAVAVVAGGWFAVPRAKILFGETRASADEPKAAVLPTAETVSPRPGGLDRVCVQPGTIEPFEAADLYAKVSGFLVEQAVDIGSRVKKGDVLARISVPEHEKQVDRDEARAKAADAKVRQMTAHVGAAEAESKAADAAVTFAKVSVRAKTAYRKYREKQLSRVKELVEQKALEGRLLDEQEDFYLSALESENAAKESVSSADERASAARSKIVQARADLDEAKAAAGVAAAELERSKVLRDYTVIKSPYSGVITRRTYHVGDFVKSAEQGGTIPLLSVERTDLMRVVVQVPDRDVPFVSLGDPAVIEIDALPGVVFESRGDRSVVVSRWSEAEDPATRTMRTEIDVKNPDNILRHGMYGRASLTLQRGATTAVRVPTGAIVKRSPGGKGAVRIVRSDRVQTVPVALGSDNGVEVEILTGLTLADQVVLRTSGPVDDGAQVSVAGLKTISAGH